MSDEATDTPAAEAAPPAPTRERTIPYARFAVVYDSRKELLVKHEAAQGELAQVRGELEPLRAQVSRLGEDLALARAGIRDEEGSAVARALYSALPEEGRPTIGDWIGGFGEDAPAPRGLAVYLSGGAPPPPDAPALATPAAPPITRTTQPGASSGPTAAQIRRAREDAQASGDWSAFNTMIGSLGLSGRSRR